MCFLGLIENDSDYWLVGDVFLISYYTVYDEVKGTITFAPRKGSYVKKIV